jgi:hypothetical protein
VVDVTDSDSWCLWPSGDKRLKKDDQVSSDVNTVTKEDLDTVNCNFRWIADQLDHLTLNTSSLVIMIYIRHLVYTVVMITVYKISHGIRRKLQIQLEKQSSFNASLKNPNPNLFS